MYGEQICDYIYIQDNAPSEDEFSHVDEEPTEWKNTTTLYANFSNKERRLDAGDSEVIGSIEGYQIFRRKYNESYMEYMGVVQKSDKNVDDFIIDYSARNGVDYVYYLYPHIERTPNGTNLAPLVTEQRKLDSPYWSLFVVDDSENENIFYLDKMFKFEFNLQINEMSNNAQITTTHNFTKYPTVQYGASNYWSGSLTALCGFLASNCADYVQTPNMIEELKSLTSDTRRKFLKDVEGNLWEVDIAAPISIGTEITALKELKTLHLSWVETGDASKAIITNNPNKSSVGWVLTESGEAVPYFKYEWGDQYRWDDSYYWTGSDDIYKVQNSNLGRNIKE